MTVYLVHADNGEHYVGSAGSERLDARLAEHRRGALGMFKRWKALGVGWRVARTWRNRNRWTEEAIKARKHHRQFCPVCVRNPRSTRGLPRPEGAYWAKLAALHGRAVGVSLVRFGINRDNRRAS